MRTPTGVRHNADSRAGTWRRQKQVQHDTWLQAGTRTTTNAARIRDGGERAGVHKIQVWHDSQGQHQEHEENQVQDTGGQGSARRQGNALQIVHPIFSRAALGPNALLRSESSLETFPFTRLHRQKPNPKLYNKHYVQSQPRTPASTRQGDSLLVPTPIAF